MPNEHDANDYAGLPPAPEEKPKPVPVAAPEEKPKPVPVAIQRLMDEVRAEQHIPLGAHDRQHNRHNRS
jgi:hypothetical protein